MPDNAQILVVDEFKWLDFEEWEMLQLYTFPTQIYNSHSMWYSESDSDISYSYWVKYYVTWSWNKPFITLPVRLLNKGFRDLPKDYG